MVVNAMLVAMAVHWSERGQVIIHVTSSQQNPLSTSTMLDLMYRYFTANPQTMGKNGKVVKTKRLNITNKTGFRAYMFLKYKLPLEVRLFLSFRSHQALFFLTNITSKLHFAPGKA